MPFAARPTPSEPQPSSGHLETESIRDPQRIILEQSEDEVDTALEIAGTQSCIILRFRHPMRTEMVDGLAV